MAIFHGTVFFSNRLDARLVTRELLMAKGGLEKNLLNMPVSFTLKSSVFTTLRCMEKILDFRDRVKIWVCPSFELPVLQVRKRKSVLHLGSHTHSPVPPYKQIPSEVMLSGQICRGHAIQRVGIWERSLIMVFN